MDKKILLKLYWKFGYLIPNKIYFNKVHPYIMWIILPKLGFYSIENGGW